MADLNMVEIFEPTREDRPQIICICGSTRFRDEMADANRQFLDELHLRKIDLADAVFVVDPGGYIGESTTREIAYARSTGKPVVRLSQIEDSGTDPRKF